MENARWKPLEKAPEGEAAASPTGGQSPKAPAEADLIW